MADDLIQRLHEAADGLGVQRALPIREAAAEIERLRARVAYLKESVIHASNSLSAHRETYHDTEEETQEIINLRYMEHHLDGTLMGLDDDAALAGEAGE